MNRAYVISLNAIGGMTIGSMLGYALSEPGSLNERVTAAMVLASGLTFLIFGRQKRIR